MRRKKQRIFGMTGCQISILAGLALVSCLSVAILAFLLYSSQISTLMVSELPTAILLPTSTYLPISTRTPFFTSTPEPTETKIPTPTETIYTKNAKDYIPSIDDIPSGFDIYPANSGNFEPEINTGWMSSYKITYTNNAIFGINYVVQINVFNNTQNAKTHYEYWTIGTGSLGAEGNRPENIGIPTIPGVNEAVLFMGVNFNATPEVAAVKLSFRIANISGSVIVNEEIASADELHSIYDTNIKTAYYLLDLIMGKMR
jgi:hypothetical protein